MEQIQELFLQAVKASLENRKVQWTEKLSSQDWLALFRLAEEHHILPMIYEAVYSCPAAQEAEQQLFAHYKRCTVQAVMLQTVKTSEFLLLYAHLRAAGVTPCVVKGIICRSLYPNPDYRMSGEEDLLIPPEQFRQCTKLCWNMVWSFPNRNRIFTQLMRFLMENRGVRSILNSTRACFPRILKPMAI